MPSVNPSTFGPCPQFVDAAGDPAVGDKLFFYAAGTTTKQNTYTDSTGTVANTNPIILDALGQPSEEVWFENGLIYKMVWAPSTDTDPPTNPIRTFDNLTGINDVQSIFSQSEWLVSGLTPSYISSTQFEVSGNQTSILTIGRRLRTINTSGVVYSTITNSVFSSVTTITVVNDSTPLDSGLSAVSYGILSSVNPSLPNSQAARNSLGLGAAVDIASAAALPLSTCFGNLVRVTGTVQTTSVAMSNGQQVRCVAVGAWPINIPGLLNYTCNPGNVIEFFQDNNGQQFANVVSADNTGSLTATVGGSGNALTISCGKLNLEFRSTTLTSGSTVVVSGDPADLVISSGSTLGTINAIESDIAVVAINNAGTIELAVINISGGDDLSETSLINTAAEGGAGGADSATTFYSTSARTGVAYRLIGVIRSTQATAGTWATAPTLVQSVFGKAFAATQSLGQGQRYANVTRTSGTTYYNTTGKPIFVKREVQIGVSAFVTNATINGVSIGTIMGGVNASGTQVFAGSFIVPPRASYSMTEVGAVVTVVTYELR
jgi:hypothetical protein